MVGTFQEQNKERRRANPGRRDKALRESGPGGPAVRIVSPVAIEPGHAPFDGLAESGKADEAVALLTSAAAAKPDDAAAQVALPRFLERMKQPEAVTA